jgi:hypothetical protein
MAIIRARARPDDALDDAQNPGSWPPVLRIVERIVNRGGIA